MRLSPNHSLDERVTTHPNASHHFPIEIWLAIAEHLRADTTQNFQFYPIRPFNSPAIKNLRLTSRALNAAVEPFYWERVELFARTRPLQSLQIIQHLHENQVHRGFIKCLLFSKWRAPSPSCHDLTNTKPVYDAAQPSVDILSELFIKLHNLQAIHIAWSYMTCAMYEHLYTLRNLEYLDFVKVPIIPLEESSDLSRINVEALRIKAISISLGVMDTTPGVTACTRLLQSPRLERLSTSTTMAQFIYDVTSQSSFRQLRYYEAAEPFELEGFGDFFTFVTQCPNLTSLKFRPRITCDFFNPDEIPRPPVNIMTQLCHFEGSLQLAVQIVPGRPVRTIIILFASFHIEPPLDKCLERLSRSSPNIKMLRLPLRYLEDDHLSVISRNLLGLEDLEIELYLHMIRGVGKIDTRLHLDQLRPLSRLRRFVLRNMQQSPNAIVPEPFPEIADSQSQVPIMKMLCKNHSNLEKFEVEGENEHPARSHGLRKSYISVLSHLNQVVAVAENESRMDAPLEDRTGHRRVGELTPRFSSFPPELWLELAEHLREDSDHMLWAYPMRPFNMHTIKRLRLTSRAFNTIFERFYWERVELMTIARPAESAKIMEHLNQNATHCGYVKCLIISHLSHPLGRQGYEGVPTVLTPLDILTRLHNLRALWSSQNYVPHATYKSLQTPNGNPERMGLLPAGHPLTSHRFDTLRHYETFIDQSSYEAFYTFAASIPNLTSLALRRDPFSWNWRPDLVLRPPDSVLTKLQYFDGALQLAALIVPGRPVQRITGLYREHCYDSVIFKSSFEQIAKSTRSIKILRLELISLTESDMAIISCLVPSVEHLEIELCLRHLMGSIPMLSDVCGLKTDLPTLQTVARGRQLLEGKLSKPKLRGYCRSPLPPKWRLVPRPNWQDQPYFVHRTLPLVTSINLLDAHAPGRRKRVKRIATDIEDAYLELVALLGALPDNCEVLFHRSAEGIDEDGEDGMSYWKEKHTQLFDGFRILVVDHRRRVVSVHPRYRRRPSITSIDFDLEKGTDAGFEFSVPSFNCLEASAEAQYWSYVSRYPHFYADQPVETDYASKEAAALATTLGLRGTRDNHDAQSAH
ncbi:hypothetical protein FRB90_012107 [Tulasnella sp. 427]|nr:hypothetical protein FRB90_012107 [Tulasnella sp. 427]